MKKLLLGLIAIISMSLSSYAQSSGPQIGVWTESSTNKPFSETPSFQSLNIVVAPGYSFDGRWSVRLPISLYTAELYRTQLGRTFDNNYVLAGSVGYTFLNAKAVRLEVAGTFGGSLTQKHASYLYYDVSVAANIGSTKSRFTIGLGARYFQSRSTGFDNNMTISLRLGYLFN